MDCRAASRAVYAAALGEIDPRLLSRIIAHAAGCPRCGAELSRLRMLVRLVDCALLGLPARAGLPRWAALRTG